MYDVFALHSVSRHYIFYIKRRQTGRSLVLPSSFLSFFFFNDTATTEIYTLSLHDALPICHGAGGPATAGRRAGTHPRPAGPLCGRDGQRRAGRRAAHRLQQGFPLRRLQRGRHADRKSTRLNSSHTVTSYAVFCLKKNKRVHIEGHRTAASAGSHPPATNT